MNVSPATRRLALLIVVLLLPCSAFTMSPKPKSWRLLQLTREEVPDSQNALARWRPDFEALLPPDPHVAALLQETLSPLVDAPPADPELTAWLDTLSAKLPVFTLRAGEALQLPPLSGPETPFPDHQPLRDLVSVRIALMKSTWIAGRHGAALSLALENLRLSRSFLRAQEGIVPLLNASGLWQLSLDGVYWLTRQPNLTPAQAEQLQGALLSHDGLAVEALSRAFRGEFTFFTRVVVDRMPLTNDPELLMSSIGSLGMAPPLAPPAAEPRLAVPQKNPFDREATLQSSAEDIRVWLAALQKCRYPRELDSMHSRIRMAALAADIPQLLRFATEEIAPTPQQISTVDAEIAATENPVGKLFLIITTSRWEPLCMSLFRREAQRSALTALLAWRRAGKPATFDDLVKAKLLPVPPADPFSNEALRIDFALPRVWSVGPNGTNEDGTGHGENLGLPDDFTWPLPLSASPADGRSGP